jgi:drug/metabolite transporter (DMT)-like permease
MLNKNSLPAGIFAGLIFPAVAWIAAYLLKGSVELINRPALPFFIAIALNLIMLRLFLKKDLDKTGRGVILITFVVMLFVFIFKVHMR